MASKVVKQLAGNGTGQSLTDRMTSVKYTIVGSNVPKIICKATTEELAAPKRKHLEYLVVCTREPSISIENLANFLVTRTKNTNITVVFKSFITIHYLMQYGHERFSKFIASNGSNFYTSGIESRWTYAPYRMGAFLLPYASYLDAKTDAYRTLAYDVCRKKSDQTEESDIRTMPQNKLNKLIPVIENQLDAILSFDASSNELSDNLLRVAYLHLYRDLIRLYAAYNEAMINLINCYFTMSKRECRTALDTYKAFLKRMDLINPFLKVAEAADPSSSTGALQKDSLLFKPVPPVLLEVLEQHLAALGGGNRQLEVYKPSTDSPKSDNPVQFPPTSATSPESSLVAVADDNLDFNLSSGGLQISEVVRSRIIEDERARLDAFVSSANKQDTNNALLLLDTSSVPEQDPFSMADGVGAVGQSSSTNSFADMFWPESGQSVDSAATTVVLPNSASDSMLPYFEPMPAAASSTGAFQDQFQFQPAAAPPASSESTNPFLAPTTALDMSPNNNTKGIPQFAVPALSPNVAANDAAWAISGKDHFPSSEQATSPSSSLAAPDTTATTTGSSSNQEKQEQPADSSTAPVNPLDAKLAELAGSFSIMSDEQAEPRAQGIDWSANSHRKPSATAADTASLNAMKSSTSWNTQLSTNPQKPTYSTTNPWANAAPQQQFNQASLFAGYLPAQNHSPAAPNFNGLTASSSSGVQPVFNSQFNASVLDHQSMAPFDPLVTNNHNPPPSSSSTATNPFL